MLNNLRQGLRIAFIRPDFCNKMQFTPGNFWGIALLSITILGILEYLLTTAPVLFYWEGLVSDTFYLLIVILGGFLVSVLKKEPLLQYRFPTLFLNSVLFPFAFYKILERGLQSLDNSTPYEYFLLIYGLLVLWVGLIVFHIIRQAVLHKNAGLETAGAILIAGLVFTPPHLIYFYPLWATDYEALYAENDEQPEPELDAEKVLTSQVGLLDEALSGIRPSLPGEIDLFWVGYAGWGEQNVFANEVKTFQEQFDRDYATSGRSLALINNPDTFEKQPLATATNLKFSLNHLAGLMQPDEDILFLFLTSHGSDSHFLATRLYNLPLNDLGARQLGQILKDSPFKWKVIVVSACYSGGFIPHLEADNHLIITAAHPERTSFGCSDDAEYTYFGRAFFVEAIPETRTFTEAFELARAKVSEWEKEEDFIPSEPQISVGSEISTYLHQWRYQHIQLVKNTEDSVCEAC